MRKYPLPTIRLVAVGMLPLILAGCPWIDRFVSETDPKLVPFESQAALLGYFKQQAARSVEPPQGPLFGMGLFGLPMMMGASAAPPDLDRSADSIGTTGSEGTDEATAFTTTNIQETGVDESDVIKSDGTNFYIARGDTLRIARADPLSELAEVGRLDLDVRVSEMYLRGSKLILLAQRYEEYGGGWGMPMIEIWPPYFVGSDLTLVEVDVSDPTAPAVTKEVELDGSLVNSRLVGGRLILVLTIAPALPENATSVEVNSMPLDEFLPKLRDSAGERDMVAWQNCLHPESPDGYYLTAVTTLDADDIESILHSVAVVGNAGTIYASTEALYLTDAEYNPDSLYREMTAIHKFAYDSNGAAQYVASGSVPGRLLNQFSLGEHEGYLRVATHVTNPDFFGMFDTAVGIAATDTAQMIAPPADFNAVYVLGQTGSELEVSGTIENIAPNEELHSARFIGDHGFVVTFRKIDPLFVLDLGDPTDPQVVGELKVPGFSDYLHPFGENHLIGVGKASVPTDEGFDWFQGVQISLFDVSDWSNPTTVAQIALGGRGSSSEVDRTHKGFTLLADSGLLAIPMRIYSVEELPWAFGALTFDGVVAFQVDTETGFTELGRLESVRAADVSYDYWYVGPEDWARAAFIDDTLYAISPDGVRAASISDFGTTTTIELAE